MIRRNSTLLQSESEIFVQCSHPLYPPPKALLTRGAVCDSWGWTVGCDGACFDWKAHDREDDRGKEGVDFGET